MFFSARSPNTVKQIALVEHEVADTTNILAGIVGTSTYLIQFLATTSQKRKACLLCNLKKYRSSNNHAKMFVCPDGFPPILKPFRTFLHFIQNSTG